MYRVEEMAARLRLSATHLHRALRRESGVLLSPSQMSALAAIDRHGPITLGALAEHEGVAPPSITKVIAVLEDDGFVTRAPDPSDRRVNFVSTTPQGAEIVAESRRRKTAWLSGRIRELSADQRQRLADALDVIDELVKKEHA
ncbi:MAG TPA: MarR family transcriptional regulator [Acidimicrobiales bacterium]|nr:MarR family transcriptional regulator [Acidimicrobiales bacterium]